MCVCVGGGGGTNAGIDLWVCVCVCGGGGVEGRHEVLVAATALLTSRRARDVG